MSHAKPSHQKTNFGRINRWLDYFFSLFWYNTCSYSSKVGCKSVPFFRFLAAYFLNFLFGSWVRCTDFCLFPLSSKLESHLEFSKHLGKLHQHLLQHLHQHLLMPKYRLLPYILQQRTKKVKSQTKYGKTESNYLFLFSVLVKQLL